MREATAATVTDSFTTTLPTTAIPTPAAQEGVGRLLGLTGNQPQPQTQPQIPRNAQYIPPRQPLPQPHPQAQPQPHQAVPVPRDQPRDPSQDRPNPQAPVGSQPPAAPSAAPRVRRTLTRADWIATALDALARDGLRAVAVEPLAERLGATKGSFYWHFRDRNALLEAAVAHWERTATDDRLKQLDAIGDPRARHYALLADLTGLDEPDHATAECAPASAPASAPSSDSAAAEPADDPRRSTQIFMVLLWNADHPVIGPVVNRVLAKRMAYSLRCRQEAGEDPQQARQAMLSAYSVILGLNLLRRAAPGLLPGDGAPREVQDYVRGMVRQAACGSVPEAA